MRKPFLYCLCLMLFSGTWVHADDEWNPETPAEPYVTYAVVAYSSPSSAGIVSGAGKYMLGQTVNLSATPVSAYTFEHWTLNNRYYSDSQNISYTVGDSVVTFVAHFLAKQTVSVTASPVEGGSVSGAGMYAQGATAHISASEKTDYTFQYWTLNGYVHSTQKSFSYQVGDSAAAFVAFFEKKPVEPEDPEPYDPPAPDDPMRKYHLALQCEPIGAAALSGTGSYIAGALASVKATYSSNEYEFENWTNNGVICSSLASFAYSMPDSDVTLVAHFKPKWHVSTAVNPAQAGSAFGAGYYTESTPITISIAGNEDFTFLHWTLNDIFYSNDLSFEYVVGDSAAAFVAFFEKKPVEPEDPEPYDPPAPDDPVAMIPLYADAPEGYYFVSWNDGVTDNPRLVQAGTEGNYTPIFELISFDISDTVEICQGDVYYLGTKRLTTEGIYKETLQSQLGADSVVTLSLIVHPAYHYFKDTTIFDDESYKFLDETISLPGTYTKEWTTAYGCDSIYVLTLRMVARKYTVTFLDEDGNTLCEDEWEYGSMPSCNDPSKADDNEYTYTFAGWSPEIVAVTSDATYTATFTAEPICYTDIFETQVEHQAKKVIREDKVYILRGDKTYTITGQEVK